MYGNGKHLINEEVYLIHFDVHYHYDKPFFLEHIMLNFFPVIVFPKKRW